MVPTKYIVQVIMKETAKICSGAQSSDLQKNVIVKTVTF